MVEVAKAKAQRSGVARVAVRDNRNVPRVIHPRP